MIDKAEFASLLGQKLLMLTATTVLIKMALRDMMYMYGGKSLWSSCDWVSVTKKGKNLVIHEKFTLSRGKFYLLMTKIYLKIDSRSIRQLWGAVRAWSLMLATAIAWIVTAWPGAGWSC
jgi:hypothetical protein